MTTPSARVLIVDDVPEILNLLSEYLTGHGYEVTTATTGAQALDLVRTLRPDALLLDLRMPGLSGVEVFDALRRAGLTLPVIAISAGPSEAGEGFFAAIEKPFTLSNVARVVAAAVRREREPKENA
jgi:two-component system OmpR family response regulator